MKDWSESRWFRHRIGSDPKLSKLVRRFGSDGYAVYFKALEYIYDGGLGDLEVEELAEFLGLEKAAVEEILNYAETECRGLLSSSEDGSWTSRKALELMDENEAKKEANRAKQKRFRDSHNGNVTVSNGYATVSNPIEKRREEKKRKERENMGEKNKEKESDDSFGPLPPSHSAVEDYMKSIGRSFNVDRFMDYWSSIGWRINGEPISDIKALVRRWPDDYGRSEPEDDNGKYAERMEQARTHL